MNNIILHVDMDAFYAAIEQRDRPELRGKPVVIGAGRNERGVVSTASYEARRFGIHSAMPSREAGRLCSHTVFLPPDMKKYSKVSEQVFGILEKFSPYIEPLSVDEAFLDVTGATRLFGDGRAIADKIRQAIRTELNLTASVGVAPNKFLAKISSDMNKPDGVTVVPDDPEGIRAFLDPLPIGKLWGVGKTTRPILEKKGILTIGDVQRMSLDTLSKIVSDRTARHFKALAVGLDDRVVEPVSEEKSISREHTFDEDTRDLEEIRQCLLKSIADVGRRLRAAGKYADVVHIKVRWKNFETITRQKTLPQRVCDDASLRKAALEIFDGMKLTAPVRLIGMGVTRLSQEREQQLSLFEPVGKDRSTKQERLSRTVDALRQKFGKDSIG